MNKPKGYDNLQLDRERVFVGPHIAVIKNVEERKSSKGSDMIVVYIDFAQEDKQAGYFTRQYQEDERPDKKWPYQAVQYIVSADSEGNTMRSFKSFVTAFENSNGVKVFWDGDFAKQFKGKLIGVNYGEVQEFWNDEYRDRLRIRWFFDVHKIDDQQIPEKKWARIDPPAAPADAFDDFMKIPDGAEEDGLPFR